MPTLPISDGTGGLIKNAPICTLAFMLFPDDEESRFFFRVVSLAERLSEYKAAKQVVPTEFIQSLLLAPAQVEMIRRVGKSTESGIIACSILTYAIGMAEHHPEHASVLKGVEVVSTTFGESPELPSSPAFIKKQWSKYRPLTPLWASWLYYRAMNPEGELALEKPAQFLRFLSIAEWHRKKGEAIVARGAIKHGPL